jgi:hypothetical protein
MQNTVKSIAAASFPFFILFGLLHITASFLVSQGVLSRAGWITYNAFDLPFLLSALTYGAAQLSLNLENITGNLKTPLIVCSALAAVLFLIALFLNFGIPDAQLL